MLYSELQCSEAIHKAVEAVHREAQTGQLVGQGVGIELCIAEHRPVHPGPL